MSIKIITNLYLIKHNKDLLNNSNKIIEYSCSSQLEDSKRILSIYTIREETFKVKKNTQLTPFTIFIKDIKKILIHILEFLFI